MTDSARPLNGAGVLVTRPAHQADRLCQMIEEKGGQARRFPTLEILPLADLSDLDKVLAELAEFHIAMKNKGHRCGSLTYPASSSINASTMASSPGSRVTYTVLKPASVACVFIRSLSTISGKIFSRCA